jgi:hypothetical protein
MGLAEAVAFARLSKSRIEQLSARSRELNEGRGESLAEARAKASTSKCSSQQIVRISKCRTGGGRRRTRARDAARRLSPFLLSSPPPPFHFPPHPPPPPVPPTPHPYHPALSARRTARLGRQRHALLASAASSNVRFPRLSAVSALGRLLSSAHTVCRCLLRRLYVFVLPTDARDRERAHLRDPTTRMHLVRSLCLGTCGHLCSRGLAARLSRYSRAQS